MVYSGRVATAWMAGNACAPFKTWFSARPTASGISVAGKDTTPVAIVSAPERNNTHPSLVVESSTRGASGGSPAFFMHSMAVHSLVAATFRTSERSRETRSAILNRSLQIGIQHQRCFRGKSCLLHALNGGPQPCRRHVQDFRALARNSLSHFEPVTPQKAVPH